jgi:hypothetical protein
MAWRQPEHRGGARRVPFIIILSFAPHDELAPLKSQLSQYVIEKT